MVLYHKKWVQFGGWRKVYTYHRLGEDYFEPQMIWKRHPRPLLIPNAIPGIRSCIVKRKHENETHVDVYKEVGNEKELHENAYASLQDRRNQRMMIQPLRLVTR